MPPIRTRVLAIVGCAVVTDWLAQRFGFLPEATHGAILLLLTIGALICANAKDWRRGPFWLVLSIAIVIGSLLLWVLNRCYPNPPGVLLMFVLCVVGGWLLDRTLRRLLGGER